MSLNIWFGVWAIYIPTVKDKLQIDKADLGFAIFFLSFGVFAMFPLASKIINKLGVGKATWFAVVMGSLVSILPLAAPNYYLLCASLFLFGLSQGLTDIAMNTLVTEIEKKDQQNFMSAAHGFFSLGGIVVGLTSFLIPIIKSPVTHMILMSGLVFAINFVFKNQYINIKALAQSAEGFNLKLFKPLLLLGFICFLSMGSEGAIVDWSALYLQEITLAPEALIGAGFLAFSFAMTLGRFLGDGVSQKVGSINVIAIGSIIAIAGFLCVLTENTFLSILGFLFSGLGFSVMVPELFRIGGKVKGVDSSQGVAFIAGTGYSGFLVGPVLLGYLAEAYTLKISFWVLLFCAVFVLLLTSILKRKR